VANEHTSSAVGVRGVKKQKNAGGAKKGANRKFSADNPYGYREQGDARQFSK